MRLKEKFFSGLRWNLLGSIIYETSKMTHQLVLLSILGLKAYGLVGSTFSFIYLTLHISDFESGRSILPFVHEISASKNVFRSFLSRYLLANLLLLSLGSSAAWWAYSSLIFSATRLPVGIIISIVLSEGVRIFFRFLLHSLFINRETVLVDLIATCSYFTAVWVPYIFMNHELTMLRLFVPYLISSCFAVACFLILLTRYYRTLSETDSSTWPKNSASRIVKLRAINTMTHLSKHFFTGNFLTPLIALKFGLSYAGLLKFASYIADSIKALLYVTIGFSGGAMLVVLKKRTLALKRKAFTVLWKTFNCIIYPLIIFITINFRSLYLHWASAKQYTLPTLDISWWYFSQPVFVISLVLLFISVTENFFLSYEEFYLVEERVGRLLGVKLFEYTLFFSLVTLINQHPLFILLSAVLVRILGFYLLVVDAYRQWKIKPYFGAPYSVIGVSLVISFLCLFALG